MEDWQTQQFRQNVIHKINTIVHATGQEVSKNATLMESHIFKKSKCRDEYLGLLAKLYLHLQDIAKRKPQAQTQSTIPSNAEIGQQNLMQDPLNALQNLASQGNRNQMMSMSAGANAQQMSASGGSVAASNLLQTLNQQRPNQQQMQQMQGLRPMSMASAVVNPQQGSVIGPAGGQQMLNQMAGTGGMSMNMISGSATSAQQTQLANSTQQMSVASSGPGVGGQAISGQLNQLSSPNTVAMGSSSNIIGTTNQIQMNAAGGGNQMNINGINMQQMSNQITPQQIQQMSMQHSQLQMINARLKQNVPGGNVNIGVTNAGQTAQGIQGMPPNVQQNQTPASVTAAASGVHVNNMISNAIQGQSNALPNTVGHSNNMNQMLNMQHGMQKTSNVNMGQSNQIYGVNRGIVGQQQFLRQSPSPNTSASPAGNLNVQQQQQQQQQHHQHQLQQVANNQQQMQLSQQVNQSSGPQPSHTLANQQMIPSPSMIPISNSQLPNVLQNSNQRPPMRQSPTGSLNTPGQPTANSPYNAHEDQLYREKYKQLTKYIEPVKRMVAKFGNDCSHAEGQTKMRKLLEILTNPSQRVSLDTLLKCEKVLEKMEIVSNNQQLSKSGNPLVDVILQTLQSPLANHTVNRTFHPVLHSLYGSDICVATPPLESDKFIEADPLNLPYVLEREMTHLRNQFDFTVAADMKTTKAGIELICYLTDKRLPNVPPIYVYIPDDYPNTSPICTLNENDYSGTLFLQSVHSAFSSRMNKLTGNFTLSHILDSWEISVRQACSQNH